MNEQDFAAYLSHCQARVNLALDHMLPPAAIPAEHLKAAMRYGVLNGGKRIRAALVYGAAKALGDSPENPLQDIPACAIECIHAYSLIHDDLPAMDDDDLRRGKPACHIAFDEATAILAGDALQTLAFDVLSRAIGIDASIRCQMIIELARGAGTEGMVAGQDLDLRAENSIINLDALEEIHHHKTGALIVASTRMGALVTGRCQPNHLEALTNYSYAIGLAFQVQDDILDVEGNVAALGKKTGADANLQKSTYPALIGLERAKTLALELRGTAQAALTGFGPEAEALRQLADFVVNRQH